MRKDIFKEVLNAMGEDAVKQMALDYINFDVDIWRLAECHKVPRTVMRKFLDYAVIHCLISDDEANQMKLKSHGNQIRHSQGKYVTSSDKRYERLFEKREAFKEAQEVNAELVQLNFQLETYDDFATFDDDGLSFKEGKIELITKILFLERRLDVLKKEFAEPL